MKEIVLNAEKLSYELSWREEGVEITFQNQTWTVHQIQWGDGKVSFEFQNQKFSFEYAGDGNALWINGGERTLQAKTAPASWNLGAIIPEGDVVSPMPGKVLKILVPSGSKIKKGDALCIVEAMKMEHKILATRQGQMESWFFKEGDQVREGQVLVNIKNDERKS